MGPLSHSLAEKEVLWPCVGYQIGKLSPPRLPVLDQEELMVIKNFSSSVESRWCTKPWERERTWKPASKFDGWASFFHPWLHSCSHVHVLHGLIVLGQEWLKGGSGAPQDEGLTATQRPFAPLQLLFSNFSGILPSTPDYSARPPTNPKELRAVPASSLSIPMCCFRLLVIQTAVR